jgi:hypothetical protein
MSDFFLFQEHIQKQFSFLSYFFYPFVLLTRGMLLDITDRIIAMGFPAVDFEARYRNSRKDVKEFLETTHPDKYKVSVNNPLPPSWFVLYPIPLSATCLSLPILFAPSFASRCSPSTLRGTQSASPHMSIDKKKSQRKRK